MRVLGDIVILYMYEGGVFLEKKKVSEAQKKATYKYEKTAYFKTLVRFPASSEDAIRAAAGDSLNGFIVSAVLEKIARDSSGAVGE